MSKACVGCVHHTIKTRYSQSCQSLFLDHGCKKQAKIFLRVVDMPRSCDDREERKAGQLVAMEKHVTEDYVSQEVSEETENEEEEV